MVLSTGARSFLLRYGSLLGLLAIILVSSILLPNFLTVGNLLTILRQVAIVALVAFGATFALILGGVDLSIASIPGIAGSLVGVLLAGGFSNVLAITFTLAVGILFGLFNGLVVTKLGVPMFLSGLAISWVARGVDLIITRYQYIYDGIRGNTTFLWLGRGMVAQIPVPAVMAGAILLVTHLVMTQTRVGRNMYAIGGSPDGAAAAGIDMNKYKLVGLAASALFGSIAGILLTSRQGVAIPRSGEGVMMDALLAAIFGTTVLTGGVPHVLGTAVGVVFTGVLMNALTQLAVNPFHQEVVKGVLLLAAVGLGAIGGRVLKVEMK
ncbi:MAG: ABC transporter permease [Bacillota bacterium]